MRVRVGFEDGLIKALEKFCGQNLTTKSAHKNADKRLNMYLVEERAMTTQTHCRTQQINYHIHHNHHQSPLHSLSVMVTRNTIHR
jgi:hypothetical protein